MESAGTADYLIRQSGCGPFQVLLVILVDMVMKFSTIYTLIFMAFGNYNPGWRCADNNTTVYTYTQSNSSQAFNSHTASENKTSDAGSVYSTNYVNKTTLEYNEESCDLYKTCQSIEFDPETSTIVTEWNLLCDKAWIPSFIISMQMAGMLTGSLIAGQLGDTFGRKKSLYIATAILCVLSFVTQFSAYWQIFTVIRFFIGMTSACVYNLYNILPAEFLSSTWRIRLAAFPSWHVGGLLFCVAAMLCKDWKLLHLIIGVYCMIACIPAIWVPESLRWLEVKNRTKDFQKVAKKLMTMNKVPMELENMEEIKTVSTNENSEINNVKNHPTYTLLDLYRKGYRLNSLIVAVIWLLPTLSYYTISYGVKAMYGNFYINLIILFAADIPFSVIPMYVPNLIGRKKASMLFLTISSTALFTATGIGLWATPAVKETGMLILALAAKMNIYASLSCNLVLTTEIYPTVVRSNALGYCNFMARVGGIIAPLLIPGDSQNLHQCYGITGTLCLFCVVLLIKLPETKDQRLKEEFEEN